MVWTLRFPVVDACTHEPVVGYRRLALSGLFGRNQDNAVGAAGAVDGRRGRVFQHVDRLDVPGVDRGQRFVVGNAVENDQRVVAGIARAGAAYADRTLASVYIAFRLKGDFVRAWCAFQVERVRSIRTRRSTKRLSSRKSYANANHRVSSRR